MKKIFIIVLLLIIFIILSLLLPYIFAYTHGLLIVYNNNSIDLEDLIQITTTLFSFFATILLSIMIYRLSIREEIRDKRRAAYIINTYFINFFKNIKLYIEKIASFKFKSQTEDIIKNIFFLRLKKSEIDILIMHLKQIDIIINAKEKKDDNLYDLCTNYYKYMESKSDKLLASVLSKIEKMSK